jgi:hypothetical protein
MLSHERCRRLIIPSLIGADMDKHTLEFATAILDRLDRIAVATERLAKMRESNAMPGPPVRPTRSQKSLQKEGSGIGIREA